MADDLWETNAGWWIEGFTEGADPEYEEQILPLAAEHLAGARRVLDVGCGDGQVARLARRVGADVGGRRRPDLEPDQRGGRARRRSALRAGRRGGAAVRGRRLRRRRRLPRVRAHPGGRRRHRRGGPGAPSRAAAFLFFLNHPLLQTPDSGWIDDQILDPPEQYWRIGPYLVEDESVEEVEKDVFIPFIHRPLSRYVNALAAHGLVVVHMEEPAAAARLPGPSPRVPRRRHHPPPAAAPPA